MYELQYKNSTNHTGYMASSWPVTLNEKLAATILQTERTELTTNEWRSPSFTMSNVLHILWPKYYTDRFGTCRQTRLKIPFTWPGGQDAQWTRFVSRLLVLWSTDRAPQHSGGICRDSPLRLNKAVQAGPRSAGRGGLSQRGWVWYGAMTTRNKGKCGGQNRIKKK